MKAAENTITFESCIHLHNPNPKPCQKPFQIRAIFGRNTARFVSRVIGLLLDCNLRFHRHCAWLLVVNTAIHIGAHLYNVVSLQAAASNPQLLYRHCVVGNLTTLFVNGTINGTFNGTVTPSDVWIRTSVAPELLQSAVKIIFTTLPGLTGVIMTLVLIIIVLAAAIKVRDID